jgi:hypothetical protein
LFLNVDDFSLSLVDGLFEIEEKEAILIVFVEVDNTVAYFLNIRK